MDINKFNSLIIDLENIIEEFKKKIPEVYNENYDYFSQLRDIERKQPLLSFIRIVIVVLIFVLWFVIWLYS